MSRRPSALIATREPALRAGMQLALEPGVQVSVAETAAQAFELLERMHPDVCFVDVETANGSLRTMELIRQLDPSTAVVLLAHSLDEDQFLQAVRLGVVGYLPESVSPERLPAVVDSVLRGEAVVPRVLVRRLLDEMRNLGRRRIQVEGRWVRLTRRETEVLELVRQGLVTHSIARRLGVADVTVRRHRSTLFAKLGVASRDELVRALGAGEHASTLH